MTESVEIAGLRALVKAGGFVLSEMLRAISESGGERHEKLLASMARNEQPMLTLRLLPDRSGWVAELVTQQEGDVCFTRHGILPIIKAKPGSAIN